MISVLLVIASFYPVGFCANMTALIKGPPGFGGSRTLHADLAGFVVGYAALVLIAALVRPQQVLAFHLPAFPPLFLLAPFVGLACIALEYLVGVGLVFVRTKRLVTRVAVHSSYSAFSRIGISDILCVLALVVGEELILRQLLYNVLAVDLAMALWIVIVLCTVAYAVNHLSFGAVSAISKLPSGLLYVLLFYISGLSVGVVIVAHATQNLALLAFSRREVARNGQPL